MPTADVFNLDGTPYKTADVDTGQMDLFESRSRELAVTQDGRMDRYALVREFGDTFDPPQDYDFCVKLIHEEVKEVAEAAAHLLKELADLNYVMTWAAMNGVDYLDAATIDNITKLQAHWGDYVDPDISDESFLRVHLSNMSKLTADGYVLRRADGKILKSKMYREPNLLDLV